MVVRRRSKGQTSASNRRVSTSRQRACGARPASNQRGAVDDAPSLLAVIDVGSRALRMAVGEVARGKPLRRLEVLNVPVAVGIDTFARGSIRAVTTEAVAKTLQDFAQVLAGYRIDPADCLEPPLAHRPKGIMSK